jgi:hypothetical protein
VKECVATDVRRTGKDGDSGRAPEETTALIGDRSLSMGDLVNEGLLSSVLLHQVQVLANFFRA